eukprot:GHVL01004234.1.p1 GENE.GHVL01004234.1~~GHVL01004234.1.p1  ORF type:complete len:151 (+),score=29.60 GHVL01004234.1:76-528(+)
MSTIHNSNLRKPYGSDNTNEATNSNFHSRLPQADDIEAFEQMHPKTHSWRRCSSDNLESEEDEITIRRLHNRKGIGSSENLEDIINHNPDTSTQRKPNKFEDDGMWSKFGSDSKDWSCGPPPSIRKNDTLGSFWRPVVKDADTEKEKKRY